MKSSHVAIGLFCLAMQCIDPAKAAEEKLADSNLNSMTSSFVQAEPGSIPENGKEDEPPKTYSMMKLNGEEHESFGHVHISKDGAATFALTPVRGSLADLTIAAASKLLGKPISCLSEYGGSEPFYIFNLKCFGWQREPEIYHIDAKTNEADKISQIRVRGLGVLKPKWQSLNCLCQ